jgi:AbrB family looped-hinge helix DNA binding protein
MGRSIVAVNKQGRLTLPIDVRRKLGIAEGTQLAVRVENSGVRLEPAYVVPDEDRWAYTPQALASLKRALADVKAGRVFEMTEAQLLRAGRRVKRRR